MTTPVNPRILVRATNWVGDAVMSLPALQAIRDRFRESHIAVLARPWVADIYARESFANEVILYTSPRGMKDLSGKWRLAQDLRARHFDIAILLQNAFEAAALAFAAGIPRRIGYDRDGRGWMLTDRIPVPKRGETPRHEQFYYLELLKRAGLLERYSEDDPIRLSAAPAAAEAGAVKLRSAGLHGPVIGVSPGAAYGTAKRWLPERFAEAAAEVCEQIQGSVALFGSGDERPLCDEIAAAIRQRGYEAHNFAGSTSLRDYIEMAAACRVYLTNDSGGMHIASALGVPTVAVFGATDDLATGPTGARARVVREVVECSPCLLRECPIDHRCMTRVTAERVALTTLELLK
jgi:heptosyltransferase-2